MFLLKKATHLLLSLMVVFVLLLCSTKTGMTKGGKMEIIDAFDTVEGWETVEAPDTKLTLDSAKGLKGKSIRMSYDFGKMKTYVVIVKNISLMLPNNFEFSFYIKRNVPQNNMEFKVIDVNGNTFWKKWYSFASVDKWKKITVSKEDLVFAWGDNPGEKLGKEIKTIEIAITGGGKGEVLVDELSLLPLTEAASEKKVETVSVKGYYPGWVSNKQAYWTMASVPSDDNEALICEDGTIEPHRRGFTLMPLLHVNNKFITRNEANITQTLERGYLPIPSVKWQYEDVIMDLKMFVYGKTGKSDTYARYTVKNNGEKEVSGKLFLVIHPYQVFPPWQRGGGISLIEDIEYTKGVVVINKKDKVYLLTEPDKFRAQGEKDSLPEGNAVDFVMKGEIPGKEKINNEPGFASAAVQYNFKLKPGETEDFFVLIPLYDNEPDLNISMEKSEIKTAFKNRLDEVTAIWEENINKFEIDIPEKELIDTLKANIAYNLVTKDGHAFQPGSRSYEKSWIRDGGMAAAALLRMGLASEVRGFIDWFTGFQYENGLVPPIIDTRAEDPLWEEKPPHNLIEYDCQGEYVYTVFQYYCFTKDRKFLEGKLDNIKRALEYAAYLRSRTLTDEFKNATDKKRQYYGILPPSTSHEGYGCEYSYWDDFWALKGWKDGKRIFEILGRKDLADWADKEYNDFKKCFYESMRLTAENGKVDYIPASASLCDFDPTSTAVAVMYCDELDNLPPQQLKYTFDRYYSELSSRFKKGAKYRFTPYELRTTPAYIYMGQKEKALELLRFMLKCRRPLGWNHFAEVVNSDYRYPGYLGDMPHTWVGAEYINAVRVMFVYEKNDALILGAGIDENWLDPLDSKHQTGLDRKEGISVKNMPTYFGEISYDVKKDGETVKINVSGNAAPPEGFVFKSPFLNRKIQTVRLNGKIHNGFSNNEIIIKKLPASMEVEYLRQKNK